MCSAVVLQIRIYGIIVLYNEIFATLTVEVFDHIAASWNCYLWVEMLSYVSADYLISVSRAEKSMYSIREIIELFSKFLCLGLFASLTKIMPSK